MNVELDELTKLLQKNPNNSDILQKIGKYYLVNGYYKQAREEYHLARFFSPRITSQIMLDHEEVLAENPKDIQARLSLTSFCLSFGDYDSAVLELEELLDFEPQNLQAYNLLGKIYIKQDRTDDAMALLEKAFSLNVKDLSISEMLASVYFEKGRLEEAIQFYEELPSDKKNLRILAELYQRVGKIEKSAEKYYKMYDLDPEVSSEVQLKLEDLLLRNISSVVIREFLAEIYAKTMKPDLAVKKFSEIIKISPEKSEEVINRFKQLLKNYPLNPEITLALAENLAQRGSYSEAIEEYYKLIRSKPDLIDKAIQGCKNIIAKFPDQYLAREFLIETYLLQEKIEDAIQEIKTLLNIYPDSADWIVTKCKDLSKRYQNLRECLGYAYIAKGDFSLANLEAENLLAQDKQNIPALLLLSNIFLKQKLCRKAAETLHKALEQSPYNPKIHQSYRDARIKELELEAEQIKKRLTEDEWKISLHLDLGKNAIARGEKDEALRELQIASKDTQRASTTYSLLGTFYRNEGLYDQSLDAFRKALQFASSDQTDQLFKIKFGMALTYEAQGQVRYAIKLLEEIEQENMDFPGLKQKIKHLKSSSLMSLQNKTLALVIRDIAAKDLIGLWGREIKKAGPRQNLSVSFGQNYNNSGIEFFLKGMISAAEEEFSLAAQLDPHYSAGINNLGVAQLISKKGKDALINLKSAYDNDPGLAVVQSNLGLALFINNLPNEAEYKLSKAIETDPELSAAKINLADVYYSNGKVKEAIELYAQVPAYDILYDLAQQRLLYKTI